ncbi:MAG: YbaK/EbsC family protein [Candidatus Omnitrophica bacterium]|nr:YbaK/EbsC family protein [Candidatus Omnitrophota bacterium]
MPIAKLRKYLDDNRIKYVVISHSAAFTAQGVAQSAHISGKEIAKTVIVNVDGEDGRMAMVVLPASDKIDLLLLKELIGAEAVELATEDEFKDIFPDCEIGAMPPFGNLYHIPVYAARKLSEDEEIAFNAGNHRELIKMKYRDFERLVKPKVFALTAVYSGM